MLRGFSCEVTGSHKLCPHNRKGRPDGPCYVLPTPPGNALRHLLVPADRSLDPGDHRSRSPHRPVPPGRSDTPSLPPVRDPVAGVSFGNWAGSSSNGPSITSSRTTARTCPTRSCPAGLVSPPLQDPQPHGGHPVRNDHPVADVVPDVHGVERSIFPLEIRLGLEAGRATPALAERVARRGGDSPRTGLGHAETRSWGAVVGRDLAHGHRWGGGGDGGPPPGRPSGSGARVAGAGGPVLGVAASRCWPWAATG